MDLEAGHREGDEEDPEADPRPPDQELDLRVLRKLEQRLVEHHQRAGHTCGQGQKRFNFVTQHFQPGVNVIRRFFFVTDDEA
jgi:hypothetical protein